ncbi:hypothetical protein PR202_ga28073 [Eleusine coracana subsp. coracana]|uniref:DYW domain-containing protein n=1 Tax=Eleusine coracana subsp. coracana TaxID=191504 RepID=A0AAV5DGT9_ELECO|nr:hypothetical protein PR202_ga28073 [Eleusine coracana subsp. coracana]
MAKLALDVPDDAVSGVYVLLSRVYASAQRWNDVGKIRQLMNEDGFKKEPGFSSIEMDGSVHQFVAGDTSHPQSEQIYAKLDEIQQRLTSAGYKPDLSEAAMVAGVDCTKGAALRLHSERLAISFGLLKAMPGAPIRILKNLRDAGQAMLMAIPIYYLMALDIPKWTQSDRPWATFDMKFDHRAEALFAIVVVTEG